MAQKLVVKNEKSSTRGVGLSTTRNPCVAVVVPCEPAGDPRPCLEALRALPKADRARVAEVWVARGLNPSRQRNLAAARARAPWILFLDSDSRAQPGQLPALLAAAEKLGAVAAGGPNLPLAQEPPLGRALDRVLGSWAGSMASRARYRAVGQRRACGEKELILCNLLLSRRAFLDHGGFREDLYPNEENELFNRLRAAGCTLAYEPTAAVRRPRRHSVGAWIQQSFRYGHGRARQIRANPYPGDLLNLLPLALPLAWAGAWLAPWAWFGPALPLAYALACLAAYRGRPDLGLLLALRHHAYAAGLLAGAVGRQEPRPLDVRLERVAWRA
ncbi:MAG TPA: glycosyltransferase [bacterium]|nr:glycosyltransferase [bacterium]